MRSGSPSETDAPSAMFFLFDTTLGCSLYLNRRTDLSLLDDHFQLFISSITKESNPQITS